MRKTIFVLFIIFVSQNIYAAALTFSPAPSIYSYLSDDFQQNILPILSPVSDIYFQKALKKYKQITFNDTFSTYLQTTMAGYQLDNINACKTGSTDVDNLAVAYNPEVLVASWVGYDDNRKMTTTNDKTVAKKTVVDVLQYTNKIKEVNWYQPTSSLQQIAINPLTGENDENGLVYWFKKE